MPADDRVEAADARALKSGFSALGATPVVSFGSRRFTDCPEGRLEGASDGNVKEDVPRFAADWAAEAELGSTFGEVKTRD
jgi:hypothetical protein